MIQNYGQITLIKIENPIVLNEQQKQVSSKPSKLNQVILFGVSSFIILLSGNPTDCIEVLDALQYQSYIRFINVAFPENVTIYIESAEIISIQPFQIHLFQLQQMIYFANIIIQSQSVIFNLKNYFKIHHFDLRVEVFSIK
ncbi:unnamed protein product (macronuclear) [Paramecium tetraurelia]|uniref:Transmembrane protein n=1 Tax=Paramecium tetraurelia TaxID=5888 RepID=A0DEA5_PARTE|nr:uncharacterized protein GSPATT00039456001 [Paramecium tetraurelia]CAK81372.1 unnamed protein product [Paramecium tetraurelia]|eukprot:XP_001448769.1 hypothetical protein (macronuclear) [Paramecium tetraurelia strain d4-2]